jgi:hypothetical protein
LRRSSSSSALRTRVGTTPFVRDWTARVKDGRIVEYKANVKIAFGVEEE